MGVEDLILWTLVCVMVAAASVVFLILSWGFGTVGDCLAADFDPVCYSVSPNQPITTDDPMWFPHGDEKPPDS